MAHLDPDTVYILMSDASSIGWGSVLLQVRDYRADLPFEEQRCEPLAFLGGTFKDSSLNWAIIDKECFAIVESVKD